MKPAFLGYMIEAYVSYMIEAYVGYMIEAYVGYVIEAYVGYMIEAYVGYMTEAYAVIIDIGIALSNLDWVVSGVIGCCNGCLVFRATPGNSASVIIVMTISNVRFACLKCAYIQVIAPCGAEHIA